MKKTKFLLYGLIPLCAGLMGCPGPDWTDTVYGDWSDRKLKVVFNPLELNTGNETYYARDKYSGNWIYGAEPLMIYDFGTVFGEGGLYDLYEAKITATTKSSRGSKDLEYKKTETNCGFNFFYVWADGYSTDVFTSQELNIQIYSGPYRTFEGKTGNLYWSKKMLATDYDKQDIWEDELKEEATLNAGKMQSTAAFKAINYGGSSSGGSSSSGGRPPLPNGMDYALDNSNLYLVDDAMPVIVDAHYNNVSTDASVSAAVMQEGTLTVYRYVSADTDTQTPQ